MRNKKIIIIGGTGFIGQAIAKYFGKENYIVILTRQSKYSQNNLYSKKNLASEQGFNILYLKWDGLKIEEPAISEFNSADVVINLAGKSVNCRYHKKQKKEIIDSRINSTKAVGEAIRKVKNPPKVWINAGSATIYKNSYHQPNDEFTGSISDLKKDNMPYNFIDHLRNKKNKILARLFYGKKSVTYKQLDLDFSVIVCKLWEKTFFEEKTPFTRKVLLRTAITLGKGGVLIPYLNLCKFYFGGRHGSGRQMFSWVHVEDFARMIDWSLNNEMVSGIYNCVAPEAIPNSFFMKSIRETIGRKISIPLPAFLLEIGAFIIGTETELMLKSRWVTATRALNEGFEFKYTSIANALKDIIKTSPKGAVLN